MNLEHFIDTYGYWAILVGTFLEGETIVVLGGFAAYRGYLSLPWVLLVAFSGTLCIDQILFYLGRNFGIKILGRRPSWQIRVDRVQRLLIKYQTWLIFMFRFLYGLRTVTPFVLGMSLVSKRRFVLLNALGASVWAIALGVGGYLFGQALEALLGDLKRYDVKILGAMAMAGFLFWMIHLYRRRRRKASYPLGLPNREE